MSKQTASIYETKPWLRHYQPGTNENIEVEFDDALAMFLNSVEKKPHKCCLGYFDASISFETIDIQSSALAHSLVEGGFKPGDRAAIYLQNIPQWLIAEIAIWKASGIVVALNPMFKERELQYHLDDSGATVLFALDSLFQTVAKNVLPETKIARVFTTNELDYFEGEAESLPEVLKSSKRIITEGAEDFVVTIAANLGKTVAIPKFKSSDIAILTYTSGTTGQPKGAMNTHGNIVFTSTVYRQWGPLTDDDVIIAVAPLFHITGLIAHLSTGTLVGIPSVLFCRFDTAEFLRLIEKWKASSTVAATTAYIAAIHHPDAKWRNLSSATKFGSGGAPVAPAILKQIESVFGNQIAVGYGLTESTSPATWNPRGRETPVDPETNALAVGLPVSNTMVYIVDVETKEELPFGKVGEIVIAGPQVVPGYWQKPEETKAAMPGGRLHTGDVGKMDEEGFVYIVDRIKDMIIASGYKVWPREVEDILYKHPAIREAGVVGVPDAYRVEGVKAYVALKPGHQASEEEIIAFCKANLADYKYPRSVEILDELPKTLTGKFLRRELRQRARQTVS